MTFIADDYTITLTIIDPLSGCSKTTTVNATVHPLPTPPSIISTPPSPTCEGSPVQLDADIGMQQGVIYWSTGEVGQTIFVYNAGAYNCTITDLAGCSATSQDYIVHPSPSIDFAMYGCFDFCQDVPDLFVYGNLYDNDTYVDWKWIIIDPTGAVQTIPGTSPTVPQINLVQIASPLQTGVYTIYFTALTAYGCISTSLPLNITIKPCPCQVEVEMPLLRCLYVDANGVGYYDFEINTNVTCPDATVIVTSSSGGVSLYNNIVNPITGIISVPSADLDRPICFNLNFSSQDDQCNCMTVSCGWLTGCGAPFECTVDLSITSFNLYGYDGNSNAIYEVEVAVTLNQTMPISTCVFSSTQGTLIGFPNSIPAGPNTYMYTGYFIDLPPIDNQLCIQLDYIDPDDGAWHQCFECQIYFAPPGGISRDDAPIPHKSEISLSHPDSNFSLIPNPAANAVRVIYSFDLMKSGGAFTLTDTRGSQLSSYPVDDKSTSTSISLVSFSPGLYYITFTSRLGKYSTAKLVVIK